MEKEKETEKLTIDPEKIIHILLKHLMYLKNENAYLKNYVAIQSSENSITENNIGINLIMDGISEKNMGINTDDNGIMKNNKDINPGNNDIMENIMGINPGNNCIMENIMGINPGNNGIIEKNMDINTGDNGILKKNMGINTNADGIAEDNIGVKSIYKALPDLLEAVNKDGSLYTVFEKGLIDALSQYIKTGDMQNTLYYYYAYFVEAVEEKNLKASKIREAALNVRFEDTHILPGQITVHGPTLAKLKAALYGHLPRTAKRELYKTVARELLFLHNEGKATGPQLRNIAELSVPGFAKHLPKLKRSGLIIKQPPKNYVLTEKSKHILLLTFGIPKNN